MGGTPHGWDRQWGELPVEGIPNGGNSPWRGSPMGQPPMEGRRHFLFFWKSEFAETACFFTFLLVANCFVDHFELSSEWHMLKFDAAFDTLYGRPSFLRNGRVFGFSVFLMDGGWGERAGPSPVFSDRPLANRLSS